MEKKYYTVLCIALLVTLTTYVMQENPPEGIDRDWQIIGSRGNNERLTPLTIPSTGTSRSVSPIPNHQSAIAPPSSRNSLSQLPSLLHRSLSNPLKKNKKRAQSPRSHSMPTSPHKYNHLSPFLLLRNKTGTNRPESPPLQSMDSPKTFTPKKQFLNTVGDYQSSSKSCRGQIYAYQDDFEQEEEKNDDPELSPAVKNVPHSLNNQPIDPSTKLLQPSRKCSLRNVCSRICKLFACCRNVHWFCCFKTKEK